MQNINIQIYNKFSYIKHKTYNIKHNKLLVAFKNKMQTNPNLNPNPVITQYLAARLKSTPAHAFLYQQIKQALDTKTPIVIGKIGTNELLLIYCYHLITQGRIQEFPLNILKEIEYGAGLYPVDKPTIETFIKVYLESLRSIDVFASWNDRFLDFEHALYSSYISNSSNLKNGNNNGIGGIVELTALESFYTSREHWWQTLFAGRCILVISPFVDSIQKQLALGKRDKVWRGRWSGFWPDDIAFKFIRFDHPWSLLSKEEQANSNLEASKCFSDKLKRFEKEIDGVGDFDIALIGAGCYSLPLCAYIKNTKHQIAFHLGGGLQMMFGVYGGRWNISSGIFTEYVNDAWIRPCGNEIPGGYKMQEGGAYF